ncbi:MAG: type I restriction-modification enzyme R subunit C-terminal domain-containing protein, partial [Candidatus Woesearchaeota archaeon]
NQLKKDFLIFIHQIIGLTQEYDPKELIERQFDEYIIKSKHYNSKQIDFLLLLKKFFAEKKHIKVEDFADTPLSEQDPIYLFDVPEMEAIVAKCNKIKMK